MRRGGGSPDPQVLWSARSEPDVRSKTIAYSFTKGADLYFTKYFWKECEATESDLEQYKRFAAAIRLSLEGISIQEISNRVGVKYATTRTWVRLQKMPKLSHYLRALVALGVPVAGFVWLSLNNSPGRDVPSGPFVRVPRTVSSWREIDEVLGQLHPIGATRSKEGSRYMFGFALGMIIGDASKSRQQKWHRHLGLSLSKRYRSNRRIGEFMCSCATDLGLRMKAVKNRKPNSRKPHGFYEWSSQSSAFFDWIYNSCLGLSDDELTTYDAVRMEWTLSAPEDFRRGLVHGLAESDGSVNVPSHTVEFWIGPNWDFGRKLLATFGLHSFRSREALCVSKTQLVKSLCVPLFSPLLKTSRYRRYIKLAEAKRLARGGGRLPQEVRNSIWRLRAEGNSITEISQKIIEGYGLGSFFRGRSKVDEEGAV